MILYLKFFLHIYFDACKLQKKFGDFFGYSNLVQLNFRLDNHKK